MKSIFPAATSPAAVGNRLRARVVNRLLSEYRSGALSSEEFDRELAAVSEYLARGDEETQEEAEAEEEEEPCRSTK